jgi:hypothetical protein
LTACTARRHSLRQRAIEPFSRFLRKTAFRLLAHALQSLSVALNS